MTGFTVGFYWFQIGTGDFLHSFFSTVALRLENGLWGSKYPVIMNELYQGELPANKTDLSSYFVTSDGEDFIGVLERALKTAAEEGDALKIESL